MISNYIRIALRNMARQKGYAFINVFGLATGMAAFVLIALFVVAELGMDQHHPGHGRTYQIQLDAVVGEETILTASSPAIMAPTFREEFPEIETAVRVTTWTGSLVRQGDISFIEPEIHFADSTVFDVFAVNLIRGGCDGRARQTIDHHPVRRGSREILWRSGSAWADPPD